MSLLHKGAAAIAKDHEFIASARFISGITLISRVFGLIRESVCACYFGPSIMHYFGIAWTIPNLFRRLFGEGALSAALIPIYTQKLHENEQKGNLLARATVTLLVLVLGGLVVLGWGLLYLGWRLGNPSEKTTLVLALTAIMLPYLVFICTTAVLGGLLNVHRHFAAPAAAPIILNISVIVFALWLRKYWSQDPWEQIYGVAVVVLLAGAMQLLMQFPPLHSINFPLRPYFHFRGSGISQIAFLMGPMVLGLSVVQINTMLDRLIAFFLSATPESGQTFLFMGRSIAYPVVEGSVNFLFTAQILYQLPLGIFGAALATAIFPHLSRCAVKKDHAGFARALGQAIRMVIFIAIPCTVGMILVRRELVKLLFERGRFLPEHTAEVAWTLLFYALGITMYCLQQIVVRAYYSLHDSRTPVKIAVRMVILNVLLNVILIWPLRTGGVALSTAICATIQAAVLLSGLVRNYALKGVWDGLSPAIVKAGVATAIMSLTGYLLLRALANQIVLIQVPAVVAVCVAMYTTASWMVKSRELKMLLKRG